MTEVRPPAKRSAHPAFPDGLGGDSDGILSSRTDPRKGCIAASVEGARPGARSEATGTAGGCGSPQGRTWGQTQAPRENVSRRFGKERAAVCQGDFSAFSKFEGKFPTHASSDEERSENRLDARELSITSRIFRRTADR